MDTQKLIMEVGAGNPGAYTVIQKLQWFTKWYDMMLWLKKHEIVGGKLWELYKDKYHESWGELGKMIEGGMRYDRSQERGPIYSDEFPEYNPF